MSDGGKGAGPMIRLRGVTKVRGEWSLMTLCHNLGLAAVDHPDLERARRDHRRR